MKPLRVCLVTRAPFLGGAEVACERLGIGLREAGHEVVVLAGEENEVSARFRAAGLDTRHFATPMRDKWTIHRYWLARHKLRRFFQSWQPDVIHSNDLPTHQVVSSAAKRLGIPRICHHRYVYDGTSIDWMNSSGCERHLFVSHYLQETLCAESSTLKSQSCGVIYDGLPLGECPTEDERSAAQARLGLPHDKVIVLFAGQIVERKGVADLLEAWSQLDPVVRSSAHLVLIGDDVQGQGAYRREMEQLAARLAVPARFLGFRQDVPEWLTAAHVAVVPSRVEPLGNATLEAMAHGLPVLGGRAGGIPEMVVHEQTGLLAPPAQPVQLAAALARLIADREACRRWGQAGRARCAELFSLASHTQSAIEEYRACLAGRSRHPKLTSPVPVA
jgi:glycosyltransferase involved in cell wall biosynthesis